MNFGGDIFCQSLNELVSSNSTPSNAEAADLQRTVLEIIRGQRTGLGASVAKGFLWLASGAYRLGAGFRNTLYDLSLKQAGSVDAKVISVGNLTVGLGLVGDTFETAITWDRWPEFDANVREAVGKVIDETCGHGSLACRFTHVYPDGPAPYYTFSGLGSQGAEAEQWQTIKNAASDAVIANGGTITHHHAVGRLHRYGYDEQRPELFAQALRAAKKAVDPNGILNPGVLIDP